MLATHMSFAASLQCLGKASKPRAGRDSVRTCDVRASARACVCVYVCALCTHVCEATSRSPAGSNYVCPVCPSRGWRAAPGTPASTVPCPEIRCAGEAQNSLLDISRLTGEAVTVLAWGLDWMVLTSVGVGCKRTRKAMPLLSKYYHPIKTF